MNEEDFKKLVGRLIRYLANTLLFISIFVFLSSLYLRGISIYSDQLLWTQINSMWLVVIMLILVENFYLDKDHRLNTVSKKKKKK
jgi:hypothetical protein